MKRLRIRETGILLGDLPAGLYNAITDVMGVKVGQTTLVSGDGPLQPGKGPVRTGVTVILPHPGDLFNEKVPAAVYTINGYGKATGFEQVRELGELEAPIALTNTLNVGLVLDAMLQAALRRNPEIGISTSTINILVGETNDSYLNDIQGRHVHAEHVWAALESARGGNVQEGAVGAGTGTSCFGWKGGIGSASRVLPLELGGYTLGALVQTNFGKRSELIISGVPMGEFLGDWQPQVGVEPGPGSVMVILATDAPLESRQLQRLCVRAAAGLARCGANFAHGSGDFVIAFSTGRRILRQPAALVGEQACILDEGKLLPGLFQAVMESVEEAVLNSLYMAEDMHGRDGHFMPALPVDEVMAKCGKIISAMCKNAREDKKPGK